MASSGGISLNQIAKDSLLRSVTDILDNPRAADTDFFVTTVDPNGVTVGSNFTLTTAGAQMLKVARRVTMTINDDDAGGGLNVRALVIGHRWGIEQREYLDATSTDTNNTTVTSTKFYDQVVSITLVAKTADSGDDVIFGIDGASFGLKYPIDNVADVQSIINCSSGTEAAPTAISSTTVDAANSGIQGITVAATDNWSVRYLRSYVKDGSGTAGDWR